MPAEDELIGDLQVYDLLNDSVSFAFPKQP